MDGHTVAGRDFFPQGPRVDSSLTLRNELSMETHVLTSDFAGSGTWGGNQQGKGSQENCSAMWLTVSGFVDGISFQVVFSQSF